MRASDSVYTVQFGLLCLSSLLFSASFNMLIPELPAYLSSMGGAAYKGLIIALFTVTAGISRPFSGKLTDTIGRVPVMAVGSLVCFVCGFLYPMLGTVAGFLLLRLLHGFSTGFKPTATAAYIADIIPVKRWGEALGIHGLCFSTGMAIGPAIGSAICKHFSINGLFYTSSFFALLSILILLNMKETVRRKQKFHPRLLRISRHDIIDRNVIPAGVITLLSYFPYGVVLTIIPDWSQHAGFENKGIYFMIFTIASLLIRFIAGKVSDRHGRTRVIKTGLLIVVLAMVVTGMATSAAGLVAGAIIYGIGTGILSPAVNAFTIDLSHPDHRGKAMATMYIALEIGIGMGALIAGSMYQDVLSMIPYALYLSAVISFAALAYMFIWDRRRKAAMVQ